MPKLEFPDGWGIQTKNPPWGECGYFLEQHIAGWWWYKWGPLKGTFGVCI